MIIINKEEFKTLLENNPGKKFAFVEWEPRINNSNLHITEDDIKEIIEWLKEALNEEE